MSSIISHPAFIQSTIGLITAILAAYVSSHWTSRRFYRERWWERKERAYVEIIEALYDIIRYCEVVAAEWEAREDHPEKAGLQDKYKLAWLTLRKVTDIGAFVISKKSAEVLFKLSTRKSLDYDEVEPSEYFRQEAMHHRDALKDLCECAKADLKV